MRIAPFLLALYTLGVSAQETELTLHSTVTGSREQPRVIYIVPWQQPAAAELNYTLDNGIGEELFAPLDRDEFVRELSYQDVVQKQKIQKQKVQQQELQTSAQQDAPKQDNSNNPRAD